MRIVRTVKDVMVSRFNVITTTAKRIKCIFESMPLIREVAKVNAQSSH